MNVVIKLEEGLAEIHIVPLTPLHRAKLALVRNHGCKLAMVNIGDNDEMVFSMGTAEDLFKHAEIEEKPNPESMSQRT